MERQSANPNTSDKASALSARLKNFESTILSKYTIDERFSKSEDYNQFYADILGLLIEENELIASCRKLKLLLTQTADTNVDKSVLTPSEGTSDETVSVLCSSDTFMESKENINPTALSEDAQKRASKEENSITIKGLQPNEHMNRHYLRDCQDFRGDEDILYLSISDSESEHLEDDGSIPITFSENINNQDETSNNEKASIADNQNTHKKSDNHSTGGEYKLKDDDFTRVCFTYLTKRCNNRMCKYKHIHPNRDHMKKILKKLNEQRLLKLVNNKRLYKKYADCFAETLSLRRFTKDLILLTVGVLIDEAELPKEVTDSVVKTTLLHLNDNIIELKKYKKYFSKRSRIKKLIFRLLNSLLQYKSLYKRKKAFVSLINFFTSNSEYENVKVSLTEKFIEKICNEPYDKCIAEGLIDMINCTNKDIFNSSAIKTFEKFISPNESVYKKYLLLKENRITKYAHKHMDATAHQNITSLHSDNKLHESDTEMFGTSPTSDRNDPRDLPGPSRRHENNINSDRKMQTNQQFAGERHFVEDITNNIDASSHRISYYPNARKKYYNQDKLVYIYNLRNNCRKKDCQFAHRHPNNEDMKTSLMQINEKEILRLLEDKELVAKYGKCFAIAAFERRLPKALMKLAVETLKSNTSMEGEVKTEILNKTLQYINDCNVDVKDCKESLNYDIKGKQVRVLLLEEILRSQSFGSLKMAFQFLINFIINHNGAFSITLAEDILKKVCSAYDHRLASDFIKILRFTSPNLLSHGLMADFEQLLKSNKELYDSFNELKNTIDYVPRLDKETSDIPGTTEIIAPIRASHSPSENRVQPGPILERKTKRKASTRVLQPINRPAAPSFVDTSIMKTKKKKIKIQPCHWGPPITSKGASAEGKDTKESKN